MKAWDIRGLRKEAGVRTQAQLANALGSGWTGSIVAAIETGLVGIDEETYDKIKAAIARRAVSTQREEVAA